jgi:endoglucanase
MQHSAVARTASTILFDPHNFGYMCDSRISNAANNSLIGVTPGSTSLFADFWTRMAKLWKNYPNVLFGLMNEPNVQTAAQWQAAASTTVAAIRTAGFTGKVTIPGTSYTGALSWVSSGNGAAWAGYSDPGHNFLFEMHQYLDPGNSGTGSTCLAGKGATALSAATSWLSTNGYKALLGEFAWTTDSSCTAEGPALMSSMSTCSNQWVRIPTKAASDSDRLRTAFR